ncbi:MAG TPA: hypothetical protein VMN58_11065 [Acidimicrobiales bacterium]|nr:hypothetical protein [Acidimicrobiales bacterium]
MSRTSLLPIIALVLFLAACSGDDDASPADPSDLSRATTTTLPDLDLSLTRSELVSDSAARSELTDPVRAEVLGVVEELLESASLTPMVTGSVVGDLGALFTTDAGERAGGPDRHLMIDEGLPRSFRVEVLRSDVGLTGLGGAVEPVQMVVARVRLELRSVSWRGVEVARVARSGDLTLIPTDDGWRISEYQVSVERDVAPRAQRRARGSRWTAVEPDGDD